MRITGRELFPEDSQGQIVFETAGTTRMTIAGDGTYAFAAAAASVSGATGTFTAGTGTAAVSGSSWVGNQGTTAYTVNDIVSALKKANILGA